jgi:vacuolar-type H+-ATPase subunit I/STV1
MFSLERMRKLQKEYKNKVQTQQILEPDYTSLQEFLKQKNQSVSAPNNFNHPPPMNNQTQKLSIEALSKILDNTKAISAKAKKSLNINLDLEKKVKSLKKNHQEQIAKNKNFNFNILPAEKLRRKVLNDYSKKKSQSHITILRKEFYENLGRLASNDTRDFGLRNLEKIMSENKTEESLKIFLNCLDSRNINPHKVNQDNEVLVLGKLIEVFKNFFDIGSSLIGLFTKPSGINIITR